MSQQTESVLNGVLIDMARSFLQYVAESWPWVSTESQSIEEQVLVIAARQRQDVSDIVDFLTAREFPIDFGTFPTEYTDLQFLALGALFKSLHNSQSIVLTSIDSAINAVGGDEEAAGLLTAIRTRQEDAASALKELEQQLSASA